MTSNPQEIFTKQDIPRDVPKIAGETSLRNMYILCRWFTHFNGAQEVEPEIGKLRVIIINKKFITFYGERTKHREFFVDVFFRSLEDYFNGVPVKTNEEYLQLAKEEEKENA